MTDDDYVQIVVRVSPYTLDKLPTLLRKYGTMDRVMSTAIGLLHDPDTYPAAPPDKFPKGYHPRGAFPDHPGGQPEGRKPTGEE